MVDDDKNNTKNTKEEATTRDGARKEEEMQAELEEEPSKLNRRQRKRKRKKKEAAGTNTGEVGEDTTSQEDGTPTTTGDIMNDVNENNKKTLEVNRTIYLEGIPFSCTQDDVCDFFAQHGLTAEQLSDVRLPVWQDSGRLRGYGHIVFSTVETQQKALQLNGKYLGQRFLTIQPAQAPKSTYDGVGGPSGNDSLIIDPTVNPSRTLILNNLSYTATEDDIRLVMEPYGTIADGGIRVVRHSQTGRSKGFAYVEYVQQDDAIRVMKYYCSSLQNNNSKGNNTTTTTRGFVIGSRSCRMDYDHGRVRGSFRTADRKLWHKEYKKQRK